VNKAAQAMQLRVAVVATQNGPATEIAKKLPVGQRQRLCAEHPA
jgi:hypothetical protein